MSLKNRSALTLEQRIEVIQKIRDRSSKCKKNKQNILCCVSFLLDIVINKRNHTVKTVNNGILY